MVQVAYVTVAQIDGSGNQLGTENVWLSVSGVAPGNTVTAAEGSTTIDFRTVSCEAVGWSSGY